MAIVISFIELLPYMVLLLVIIAILIFYILREKKRKVSTVNENYVDSIIEALGDMDNIVKGTKEHKRIQIELKSTDHVDIEKLKTLKISAFLTANKITLLIHEQGDHLLDHIKSKRKEER